MTILKPTIDNITCELYSCINSTSLSSNIYTDHCVNTSQIYVMGYVDEQVAIIQTILGCDVNLCNIVTKEYVESCVSLRKTELVNYVDVCNNNLMGYTNTCINQSYQYTDICSNLVQNYVDTCSGVTHSYIDVCISSAIDYLASCVNCTSTNKYRLIQKSIDDCFNVAKQYTDVCVNNLKNYINTCTYSDICAHYYYTQGKSYTDICSGVQYSANISFTNTCSAYLQCWTQIKLDCQNARNHVTGWLYGARMTITCGDTTVINVSPGAVQIVDYTVCPMNPTIKVLKWDVPLISACNVLDGNRTKWVGVQDSGTGTPQLVYQQGFCSVDRRDIALLGKIRNTTGQGPIITNIDQFERPAWNILTTVQDYVIAMGSFSIDGNVFSTNDSLKLSKSAGNCFRYNAEQTKGLENIHYAPVEINKAMYNYHLQGCSSTLATTDIDPNHWSNAGVYSNVGNGNYTRQELYFFPVSNSWHVLYGQAEYTKLSDAQDAGVASISAINTLMLEGSFHAISLIMKKGITDLSSAVTAGTARLIPIQVTATVGTIGAHSHIIGDVTYLQTALDGLSCEICSITNSFITCSGTLKTYVDTCVSNLKTTTYSYIDSCSSLQRTYLERCSGCTLMYSKTYTDICSNLQRVFLQQCSSCTLVYSKGYTDICVGLQRTYLEQCSSSSIVISKGYTDSCVNLIRNFAVCYTDACRNLLKTYVDVCVNIVDRKIANFTTGMFTEPYCTISTDLIVTRSHFNIFVTQCATLYLPTAIGIGGRKLVIYNTTISCSVTILPCTNEKIIGLDNLILYPPEAVNIISDNANWWIR